MDKNEIKDDMTCSKVNDSTKNRSTVLLPEFVNIKMEIDVEDTLTPYNVIIKEERDQDIHDLCIPNVDSVPCVKKEQIECSQNGNSFEFVVKKEELPIEYDGDNTAYNSMSHLCEKEPSPTDDSSKRVTGIERKRERQQRYRERKRDVIRERNRNYYLKRRQAQNGQTVNGPGEDIKRILRKERDRRYREEHRETLKQRSKDYRRRKKHAQKGSGGVQDPNREPPEGKESPPV